MYDDGKRRGTAAGSGNNGRRSATSQNGSVRRNVNAGGSAGRKSTSINGSALRGNTASRSGVTGKNAAPRSGIDGTNDSQRKSAVRENAVQKNSRNGRNTVVKNDGIKQNMSNQNVRSGSAAYDEMTRRKSGNENMIKSERSRSKKNERKLREAIAKKEKQQRIHKIVMVCSIFVILILLTIGICWSVISHINGKDSDTVKTGNNNVTVTGSADNSAASDVEDTPTPTPTIAPTQVKLVAVGDDLVHTGVYKAGHREDGSFDYSCLFANIKPYLEDADIKIINQETIFGGDDKGASSYPSFNTPTAIGDAAVSAGFNVFTHATNHAFDMGIDGLLNCVKYWKEKHPETFVVGIYDTKEEQAEIPVMEVDGIKIAILNYTYSHNWETFSSSAEGHLNMLCAYDETTRVIDFNTINPQVIEDIKKAEEIADFTIVCPHWGTEYVHDATTQEVNFAKLMTEAGADLIIGTHPHVIQPVEWVTADNGNKSLCYYSLGNFTSTQDEWERLLGGMASLTIVKDADGTYIDESTVKAIPLVTHYVYPGWNGATVVDSTYSLANYTEEQAAAHGIHTRCGINLTRDNLVALANQVFGDYCSIE